MATTYPVRFSAQLRQHLKSLRTARKLTQAQLGQLVGVSQARIAEIEASPGLVSFDQLMQILSALSVTITLNDDVRESETPAPAAHEPTVAPYVQDARLKKGTW
jgi:HTH-type transcriptional regulator/antitoxin HipB